MPINDTAITMAEFDSRRFLPFTDETTVLVQVGNGSEGNWFLMAMTGDFLAIDDFEPEEWDLDPVPEQHGYYVGEDITLDLDTETATIGNWRIAAPEDFELYGVGQPMVEPEHLGRIYEGMGYRFGLWDGSELYEATHEQPIARYEVLTEGEYVLLLAQTNGGQYAIEVLSPSFPDFIDAADDLLSTLTGKTWHSMVKGGLYQHYKGGLYVVTGVGLDTEQDVPQYSYHAQGKPRQVFHRYAHMWADIVETDTGTAPRFTLL